MDSSSFQNHPSAGAPPRHCTRGCGFFGSPEKDGLCSKCYADELKKKKVAESEQTATIKKTTTPELKTTDHWVELITDHDWVEHMRRLKEGNVSSSSPALVVAPNKNRCGCCNKKVGLLGFTCRCGGSFCGTHRYAEKHMCTFDFKAAGKVTIEKQNPVVRADKLSSRA